MKTILNLLLILILTSNVFADTRIITVAKSGGDYTDPILAMDSITDATNAKRYKVRIGPGIYNLGTGQLKIKPYVSVEGSGVDMTLLKGEVIGRYKGLIRMEQYTKLSRLAVKNTASVFATGIFLPNALDISNYIPSHPLVVISHVHVSNETVGGFWSAGIISLNTSARLDYVELINVSPAYRGYRTYLEMRNSTLFANGPESNTFGGTGYNLRLSESRAIVENVRFRARENTMFYRHIDARSDTTVKINKSEIEAFGENTILAFTDSSSKVKIISSDFSGSNFSNLANRIFPNARVKCVGSTDSDSMVDITKDCLHP